jgi:hypothetical protein
MLPAVEQLNSMVIWQLRETMAVSSLLPSMTTKRFFYPESSWLWLDEAKRGAKVVITDPRRLDTTSCRATELNGYLATPKYNDVSSL